ncbi:MAG: hypothetical protein ACRDT8_16255, partial [Micromonosporaceae bacterium]
MAIYDFAIDDEGNIPALPPEAQSLVLVDGTLTGGTFTPDTTAPAFPRPADLHATVQAVTRRGPGQRQAPPLVVSSMLLGQVQPTRSPIFHFGDDGIVHLYYGGPPPTPPFDRWSSLDPAQPQAMVAQFDARANRLVMSAPWKTEGEQEAGVVEFIALQSGCIMSGATVAVSDGRLGDGPAEPDLCTVHITYPPASGLSGEIWQAAPRSLETFMAVLNGKASDDSADPEVLSGATPFYDYAGTRPIARLPLKSNGAPTDSPEAATPPKVTVVSTRGELPLHSVTVSTSADGSGQDYAFHFAPLERGPLAVTWRNVPRDPAALGDVFDGSAAPRRYEYPPDPGGTPLFGLVTDAVGIPAPVVLYSLGTHPSVSDMKITVASGAAGTLDVTFITPKPDRDQPPGEVSIRDLPADVDCFVERLRSNDTFKTLGLGISAETAGGNVMPTTSPVGRMPLAATAVLFDVLLPVLDVAGVAVATGSYTAGRQGRPPRLEPLHPVDDMRELIPTRRFPEGMVGFLAASSRPSAGATAYVKNTAADDTEASASRSLHAHGDADPLVSGVWIRQAPQWQCSFTQNTNAVVPMAQNGGVTPVSANLRPQRDWTLETWVRPRVGRRQRVVTFLDDKTPVPAGAPALDYAVALESQQVVQGHSYAKAPGMMDSSFFQTGTSNHVDFMPTGGFTWELWVKPDAAAGPAISGGVTPIGGVIQLGREGRSPFLMVGLSADR